jgi:hypothetical protein
MTRSPGGEPTQTTTFVVTMTFEIDVPPRTDWENQRSALYSEAKLFAFRKPDDWHETGIEVAPAEPHKKSRHQRYREVKSAGQD